MKKRKILCIVLLVCIILHLSGCFQTPGFVPKETVNANSAFHAETLPFPTAVIPPLSTEPDLTAPSATEPAVTEPVPPEFSDLVSLSFYLNDMKEADVFDIQFRYSGNDVFDAPTIARMTNACYVVYFEDGCGNYELHLTEYPGDRIVDAWRSGSTEFLTEDETDTLETAVSLVEYAKANSSAPIELEILLHDLLIEHVYYCDDTREITDPLVPPRNLTAVGALLDGYANCQGYTDAFYVLASIAGFQAGRMSVYTPDDLHAVNTVCINGNWYVVDVTFDDSDGPGSNYRLFNAGRDIIFEYSWHEYNETYPIAYESDENYYYNFYGLVYTDVDTLAADIAHSFVNGEETVFRAMVLSNDNSDEFNSALYDELNEYNVTFNYTYWSGYTGRDMVYTVYFE
ncbi:MAG: hypothetical protein IKM29_06450 [Clostridia bacterium]|nr:hypothetical protein [Clostridia bacterium]